MKTRKALTAARVVFLKKGTADEIATQEELNTRRGVERIIVAAFEYARANGRKRVTMADKSNVQRFGGDLWQRVFKEVAADYSEIEANHQYVDAMAMFMVLDPAQYDVIVSNNLFGDILTDLGAAIQGGLGLAASGNIHPGRVSLFEPVHGSAPAACRTGKSESGRRYSDLSDDARISRPQRSKRGDRESRQRSDLA